MITGQDPQQAAAGSNETNLLVVAPPGCGKTEFLAMRAQALIPQLRPGQRILALTFTNRAKANLTDRLRRVLGQEMFRRYVSVRNFHGHAADIVLAHGTTLGLQVSSLRMPTTKTLKAALASVVAAPGERDTVAGRLAEVKRQPLSDPQILAALGQPGDELARRVEADRASVNQLHFEDLLRHAQRLLHVEEVANLYHQHYGAVLVDEFQDLSLQELDIAMRSSVTSRTFAGDPLQGIYSWAGAAPQEVEAILRKQCASAVQLTVSYRSSPAVLAMVNSVSARMGALPLRARDPSAWDGGGASAAIMLGTMDEEARFIVQASEQIIRADPAASVGVIARSGWRRMAIDRAFTSLSSVPCRKWDLAIEDPSILDQLRSALAAMPRDVTAETARDKVIARIDPSDVDTIGQITDAFDHLAGMAASSMHAALQQIRARGDDTAVAPGVHLLNAHTGKGQQFDWVFIPGLEEKHIPDRRSTTGSLLAEEERVLLVMLSRAKHGVVLTTARTLDGPYGPYTPRISRWWDGLAASATMERASLAAHLARRYPPPTS